MHCALVRAGTEQQQARYQDQAGGGDSWKPAQGEEESRGAAEEVRHQEQRHGACVKGAEEAEEGAEDEDEAEEGDGDDEGRRGGGTVGGGGSQGVRSAPQALISEAVEFRRSRVGTLQPEHRRTIETHCDVTGSWETPGGGGERGEERARGV